MPQLSHSTSYLVLSEKPEKVTAYQEAFTKERHIHPLDVTFISKNDEGKNQTKNIGIEEIKIMQKNLFLYPHKGENKLIVIPHAEYLTLEAQSALLKTLEEPPNHCYFMLITSSLEVILPTILSRCLVVRLISEKETQSTESQEKMREDIVHLSQNSLSDALAQAEKLSKKKEEAITWLTDAILTTRTILIEQALTDIIAEEGISIETIRTLQNALLTIKTTNANSRLVLENMFLGLSKTT